MYNVVEEQWELLEEWFPGQFKIEYNPDVADYVYESEKLATLAGKKLHSKRSTSTSTTQILQLAGSFTCLRKHNVGISILFFLAIFPSRKSVNDAIINNIPAII